MTPPSDSTEREQLPSLSERLEQCLLPALQRACRYAESQDLQARVQVEQMDEYLTRASLSVQRPGDAAASTYLVLADAGNQRVVHEQFFAADQVSVCEDMLPAALNDMVIDSRLQAFFSRAFNLLLPYMKERHPPGF